MYNPYIYIHLGNLLLVFYFGLYLLFGCPIFGLQFIKYIIHTLDEEMAVSVFT